MEKYKNEGRESEVEYSKYGSPIYDSTHDFDETRDTEEETEYDDEGYPVGRWIPSMVEPKTMEQLIKEKKEQRKTTLYVIVGCIAIIALCFGLSILIVKP